MKITLSRPVYGRCVQMLEKAGHTVNVLDENRQLEAFRKEFVNSDAVITMLSDVIDASLIENARNLKVVSNYAVGFNNIDIATCKRLGIAVTNTPDVLTDATADIAMTLILMSMRRIQEGQKQLFSGQFSGWRPIGLVGYDLAGKTLGIVGMGRIGKAVAKRAESFGMKIVYCSRSGVKPELMWPCLSMSGLLSESDVVSLHLPYSSETKHLIGEKEFKMMKKTGVLINTARGPIVDENALVEALEKGTIFSAGLDVYENEPAVHPGLLKLPNAVLLPHMGSSTLETRERMGALAAKGVIEVLAGNKPENLVE
ncbi:MAG: D-glycerate dehydrogenase [Candidatus Riflebacteria bacterium]|nr:D-glycerate dehydrogenase [Candidatus Riflebacteria bacterium]